MTHVPDELLSNLNVLTYLPETGSSYVKSSRPPPQPRRVATSNPRTRSRLILQEQQHAERLRRDLQRPKFVLDNSTVANSKPPAYFIEQARQRFLARAKSPSVEANSSVSRSTARSESRLHSAQQLALRQQVSQVYPDWLVRRADFVANCKRLNSRGELELDKVVQQAPKHRSEENKVRLVKWLVGVSEFIALPESVLKEFAEQLSTEVVPVGTCLSNTKEQLNIVFTGTAEDSEGNTHGPKSLLPRSMLKVTAQTALTVFVLKQQDFDNALFNRKQLEKQTNTQFLKKVRFFKYWSHLKVQRLCNSLVAQTYQPDEVIYDVDADSEAFFIVKEGTVEIQTYASVSQQNQWPVAAHEWEVRNVLRKYIVPLHTVQRGKYFGEIELIDNQPRTVRAVAATACVCLVLAKAEFFDIFTSKDIDKLRDSITVSMPTEQELQQKVLDDIAQRSNKEKALLDAMQIDYVYPKSRQASLEPRAQQRCRWVTGLQERKNCTLEDLKKKVVEEHRQCVRLDATQLGLLARTQQSVSSAVKH